jgi:hypothetical protein
MGVWGLRYRRSVASVDVPVALLGYGTVGSPVGRLLEGWAADLERATGHRLCVVRGLVTIVGTTGTGFPQNDALGEMRGAASGLPAISDRGVAGIACA